MMMSINPEDAYYTATTISTLVAAGYTPKSVSEYLRTGDVNSLRHTGTTSTEQRRLDEIRAETMNKLVREGWTVESVKKYLLYGNVEDLEHTGYISVQLFDPGQLTDEKLNEYKKRFEAEHCCNKVEVGTCDGDQILHQTDCSENQTDEWERVALDAAVIVQAIVSGDDHKARRLATKWLTDFGHMSGTWEK